ncbi:hypothetical protein D1Z90_19885 [Motilimonas pumila]|uniref:Uncharacterized protein n=1 Tax=Motilimonas pumila TaxID=2303987 RepID=A0A418Y9G7_9GAMM|nr:hypothetical protein D1Z90_19885 [Motilimonas pumila]
MVGFGDLAVSLPVFNFVEHLRFTVLVAAVGVVVITKKKGAPNMAAGDVIVGRRFSTNELFSR